MGQIRDGGERLAGIAGRIARSVSRGALVLPLWALAACGTPGMPGDAVAGVSAVSPARAAEGGDSPLGSYLAGRLARAERDTAAAARFFSAALARDPENPALLRRTVMLLAGEGRVEEAAELAARLARHEPRDGIANLVLAVEDIRGGRPAAAAERLRQVPQTGFNMLLVPMIGAWAAQGEGNAAAAAEALSVLGQNTAFAPFHQFHSALLHDLSDRAEAAEQAYREVLAGGSSLRVVQAFGNFLVRHGRLDEARALYADYLTRYPESPLIRDAMAALGGGTTPPRLVADAAEGAAEALYGAASVLSREDAMDAGEIYSQLALRLRPDFTLARMLLGEIHENSRRWDSAIATYSGVDATSPFHASARLRTAWVLRQSGRVDEALALLREMIALPDTRTEALTTMGDILRGEERFAEAVEEYSRAIETVNLEQVEARHWSLYYSRGVAYERLKRWDPAEADLLQALALNPDQPLVLNYLGYSWVEQGANLDRARAMIERAVELRPNDGYIIDSLGWALYRLGRFPEAVVHLERAVELRPEDPTINDHLGDALWQVGRRAEARFQWRRALTLEPEPDVVASLRRKLERGLEPSAERSAQSTDGP